MIIGTAERVAKTTQFSDESNQDRVVSELIGGAWGREDLVADCVVNEFGGGV